VGQYARCNFFICGPTFTSFVSNVAWISLGQEEEEEEEEEERFVH